MGKANSTRAENLSDAESKPQLAIVFFMSLQRLMKKTARFTGHSIQVLQRNLRGGGESLC